jgi:hypothetical protein
LQAFRATAIDMGLLSLATAALIAWERIRKNHLGTPVVVFHPYSRLPCTSGGNPNFSDPCHCLPARPVQIMRRIGY